jgi:hypothetical protein
VDRPDRAARRRQGQADDLDAAAAARAVQAGTALDTHLERLVAMAAPALVAVNGVGTETAAALLVAAGANRQRLRSEAGFAYLCGSRRSLPPRARSPGTG